MNTFVRSYATRITLGLSLLTLVGCGGSVEQGPPEAKVTGTVSFDGKPLETGSISLLAEDGSSNASGQIKDGKFEVLATAGAKKVQIKSYRAIPGKFREENPGEKTPVTEQIIPKKFNDNTTLTAEVKLPETLDLKFDLTAK